MSKDLPVGNVAVTADNDVYFAVTVALRLLDNLEMVSRCRELNLQEARSRCQAYQVIELFFGSFVDGVRESRDGG